MTIRRLTVNQARFAHDTVDGEALIIDTLTGQLILLNGLATTLWERLRPGVAADQLLAEVRHQYGDDAAATTGEFLHELQSSGLVVETDGPATQTDPSDPSDPSDHGTHEFDAVVWPATYLPPTIERIDDIADIMSMDPIHDVDPSRGWPHANPSDLR